MRIPLIGVLVLAVATSSAAEDFEDDLVNNASAYRRKKAAEELSKSGDVEAIHRGVKKIVKNDSEANREFLIDMVTNETNPLLRLRYGLGLERMGADETGPLLAAKLAGLKPELQVRGLEVLGLLSWKEKEASLLEFAASRDRLVATEAFRALARTGSKKIVDQILTIAASHPDEMASMRGAWAAADIMGDVKPAASRLRKLERDVSGEAAARVVAMRESFENETFGSVFKYRRVSLEPVEKWFTKRKPKVEIDATSTKKIEDALKILEKTGSWHQLVVRAFDEINGKGADDTVDFKKRTFHFRVADVASPRWKDEHFAYALARGASMMLLYDIHDIHWHRRGFEQGLKNAYWFIEAHPDIAPPGGGVTAFIDDQSKPGRWTAGSKVR